MYRLDMHYSENCAVVSPCTLLQGRWGAAVGLPKCFIHVPHVTMTKVVRYRYNYATPMQGIKLPLYHRWS